MLAFFTRWVYHALHPTGHALEGTLCVSVAMGGLVYLGVMKTLASSLSKNGEHQHRAHYFTANVLKMVCLLSNMCIPQWWHVLHTFIRTTTLTDAQDIMDAEALMVNFITLDAIGLLLAAVPSRYSWHHANQSRELLLHHAFTVAFVLVVLRFQWTGMLLARLVIVYGTFMTPTGVVNGLQGVRRKAPAIYYTCARPVGMLYGAVLIISTTLCAMGTAWTLRVMPWTPGLMLQTLVGWMALSIFLDQDVLLMYALLRV